MKKALFKVTTLALGVVFTMALFACERDTQPEARERRIPRDPNEVFELEDNKIIVYQMMTRLFANTVTNNVIFGTIEENGVGKFNDINDTALTALKDLGITHMYYTGVIAHMVMRDYTEYGIPLDDGDIIKGRAGSPFAIRDYYDVNPDMAVNVRQRMREFETLVQRTHKNGLKVIIDFVPNHVARNYKSIAKPRGVKDLGEGDNTSVAFDPNNNFYYLPGKPFEVPKFQPIKNHDVGFPTIDGKFEETPAKVTGNDVFTHAPSVNDWFETVKLNYGVDIQGGRKTHFDPIPKTWHQMLDILKFWVNKGVDGFRCDMANMVPVEFWEWATPQVRKINPDVIFIAEMYAPNEYPLYIERGGFNYVYDKVGLYDSIKPLISHVQRNPRARNIYFNWRQSQKISSHMFTFLENHDEYRVASRGFARDPFNAIPGMVITATIYNGPVMIYFGQEVGEPGEGVMGFSGNDGRTSIFDYWGVPEHQKWVNNGKFDGGQLSDDQKKLRSIYRNIFKIVRSNESFRKGNTYDLNFINRDGFSENYDESIMYSYIRYTDNQAHLVFVNFNRQEVKGNVYIKIPEGAWENMGLEPTGKYVLEDIFLSDTKIEFDAKKVTELNNPRSGVPIKLKPYTSYIFELKKVESAE
jgi:glycosidase